LVQEDLVLLLVYFQRQELVLEGLVPLKA